MQEKTWYYEKWVGRHASFPPSRYVKLSLYLLPKFSRVPFTIVLISRISTVVNGTLLNFSKKYKDDLKGSFLTSGKSFT